MAKDKKTPENLEELQEAICKKHGAGSVIRGRSSIVDIESFPTGVISIDLALGCGGLPLGRIIELYGPESSGKTTTTLTFIAACQKHFFKDKNRYGVAAFIDAEHALDPEWAEKIGVKWDDLLISQPDSGEEAFQILEEMIASDLVDLVVVDSVAALVTKAELEGEVGDSNIGAQARLMSQGLRRLKGPINKSKSTVIFINQIREKIGVMFGNPETTPGGRALKFYATNRMEIKKVGQVKDGDAIVGIKSNIKVVKNKAAPPFRSGAFDICFGVPARPIYGIDCYSAMVEAGLDLKVLTKSSTYIKYKDTNLGNGMNRAITFLRDNPDLYREITQQIYSVAFQMTGCEKGTAGHEAQGSQEPSQESPSELQDFDNGSDKIDHEVEEE